METASDGPHHNKPDDDITIRHGIPLTSATARSLRDLHAPDDAGRWRFSQCFGDKSEEAEVSDGTPIRIYILTNCTR